MAFNVNVKADPAQLAYLRRIAEAGERSAGALERIAPAAETGVDELVALVAVAERIAVAIESITQPTVSDQITRTMSYRFNGRTFGAEGDHIMLTAKATEVPGTAKGTIEGFADAEGNAVSPDTGSVPSWAADDPTVVDSVTVAADGLSADIHLTNKVGASNLAITATFGGVDKTFVDVVQIVPGDATAINLTFGPVVPD